MMSVGSAAEPTRLPAALLSHATNAVPFVPARTTGAKSRTESAVRLRHDHAPVAALRTPTAISIAPHISGSVTSSENVRPAFAHVATNEPSDNAAISGMKSAVPSSHTASAVFHSLLVPIRATSSVRFAEVLSALSRRYASASPAVPLATAGAGLG